MERYVSKATVVKRLLSVDFGVFLFATFFACIAILISQNIVYLSVVALMYISIFVVVHIVFFKYAKMGEVQTGGKTFSMLCVSTKDLDASPIRRTIDANRIKRLVFDKNSSIAGYYFGTFYYAELEPSEEKGILYGFWAKDVEKLGEELGIPYDKLG